jgi:hypothetical protein
MYVFCSTEEGGGELAVSCATDSEESRPINHQTYQLNKNSKGKIIIFGVIAENFVREDFKNRSCLKGGITVPVFSKNRKTLKIELCNI